MINRSSSLSAAAIMTLCLLSLQPACAEETVASLKEKAEADLRIETEKLKLKYLIALEKLQKKLASDGDLDGAIAVKKESDRADAENIELLSGPGASIAESAAAGGKITLGPGDGRLGNGTQLDKEKMLIKGWSRYGAFAAWELKDIKPGNYRVTLNYHSGNLGGGVLSIRTANTTEKFSIAGAGKWDELRSHAIGKFHLSGPDHLTIAALQGRSREMIYVDSITLEPTP